MLSLSSRGGLSAGDEKLIAEHGAAITSLQKSITDLQTSQHSLEQFLKDSKSKFGGYGPPALSNEKASGSSQPSQATGSIRSFTQEPPRMTFTGTPYMTINVKGFGAIKIRLDPKAAPRNVSNVYQLAHAGFYDGVIFHRVIKNFMIQAGDPTGTGAGGPTYRVPAEIKLKNVRGAVAMARQGDQVNPTKASSSCQFYIILKDQPGLDQAGYTVIGHVVAGMDVVDRIADVPVKASSFGEMSSPVSPVVMEGITVSLVQ
jgi:cyclophilin family peptidyl-prolyl cis-trans isomerase